MLLRPTMVKSYSDLSGLIGRAAFYRPERKHVHEVLSRDAIARVRIGELEYPVVDLSINGVAFESPTDTTWSVGQAVALSLWIRNREVFNGEGHVARVCALPSGNSVAVGLDGGFFDLAAIRHQDEEAQLEAALLHGAEPFKDSVPQSYRAAVSRAVVFANYYKRLLDHHEARYTALGEGRTNATDELAARAFEKMLPAWRDISRTASTEAAEFMDDPATVRMAKQYTETLLSHLLMSAPVFARSQERTLGQTGDHQVELYCHQNRFEGGSAFAKAFHKVWVNHPLAAGVRGRSELLVDILVRNYALNQARNAHETLRFATLGCGAATEVSTFSEKAGSPSNVSFGR